ncbi:MAG: tetratricopeptide repeat protein, partial [Waterburya sp.]
LRNIAPKMAENIKGLEPIFAQTARINQYDAQQDYLPQAELALNYRLQHNQVNPKQQLNWLYGVALSQILQQDVDGAIATFRQITQLDPQNSYGYAYLAFVHLYDWQPQAAETALNSAMKINPNIPEIKTLSGVAAIMQGKFIKAWKVFRNDE